MSAAQTKPAVDAVDNWISFDDAYDAFVQAHPMLGLQRGEFSTTNLRRNFGPQLLASGAAIKLANRRWIAHRTQFGPALFAILTRTPAEIIQGAKARQAAAARQA